MAELTEDEINELGKNGRAARDARAFAAFQRSKENAPIQQEPITNTFAASKVSPGFSWASVLNDPVLREKLNDEGVRTIIHPESNTETWELPGGTTLTKDLLTGEVKVTGLSYLGKGTPAASVFPEGSMSKKQRLVDIAKLMSEDPATYESMPEWQRSRLGALKKALGEFLGSRAEVNPFFKGDNVPEEAAATINKFKEAHPDIEDVTLIDLNKGKGSGLHVAQTQARRNRMDLQQERDQLKKAIDSLKTTQENITQIPTKDKSQTAINEKKVGNKLAILEMQYQTITDKLEKKLSSSKEAKQNLETLIDESAGGDEELAQRMRDSNIANKKHYIVKANALQKNATEQAADMERDTDLSDSMAATERHLPGDSAVKNVFESKATGMHAQTQGQLNQARKMIIKNMTSDKNPVADTLKEMGITPEDREGLRSFLSTEKYGQYTRQYPDANERVIAIAEDYLKRKRMIDEKIAANKSRLNSNVLKGFGVEE